MYTEIILMIKEYPLDLLTAIHTRQSISKVLPDPVPRALIEQLLDAAVQAPNHYHNRPWRFIVLTGAARQRLGDIMAQSLLKQFPDIPPAAIEKERAKPLRAPVLIAVAVDLPDQPNIIEIENVCAGAAAVENLLLAAHDLGIGAIWRTGSAATDPDVKRFLNLSPDQPLIAIVYVGYPAFTKDPPTRPSFADHTIWIGD